MHINGNVILITGGGSGIGAALAEKFHAAGNKVIVAGRDAGKLDQVVAANPGMERMTFDVADAASVARFAADVVAAFPELNVVINNAGIMRSEDMRGAPGNLETAEATVATNLLGPIRLTSALLPHFLTRPAASVVLVSSGLAFVPLASTPTYSATKAAIHSYAVALREQLKDSKVAVTEIIPPYVRTHLTGDRQANDPHAMPLADFVEEVMAILAADPAIDEVVVERCKPLRFAVANGDYDQVFARLNAPR